MERDQATKLVHSLLKKMVDKNGSDLFITSGFPPAIKIDGVPLYKLARKGKEVEREARFVRVYDSEITRFESPEVDFRVVCSKGFYVRTYAHDIGAHLGCGAHLSALRRTRSGSFRITEGNHVTFPMLKAGDRAAAVAAMMSLYDVSKLRGA